MNYESEFKRLAEIHVKNRENILKKYDDYKLTGLDGEPYSKELREESKRFWEEIEKLKLKYSVKSK